MMAGLAEERSEAMEEGGQACSYGSQFLHNLSKPAVMQSACAKGAIPRPCRHSAATLACPVANTSALTGGWHNAETALHV